MPCHSCPVSMCAGPPAHHATRSTKPRVPSQLCRLDDHAHHASASVQYHDSFSAPRYSKHAAQGSFLAPRSSMHAAQGCFSAPKSRVQHVYTKLTNHTRQVQELEASRPSATLTPDRWKLALHTGWERSERAILGHHGEHNWNQRKSMPDSITVLRSGQEYTIYMRSPWKHT
eukprot:scaffold215377_cov17-Tisochrysis_lutea.AAC.1